MSNYDNVGTPPPCVHHTHNLAVFIGRFQPFHLGHLHIVEQALTFSDCLTILVGSSYEPREYFNPFTFDERKAMIRNSIPQELRPRVLIQPLVDWTYQDNKWVVQVQEAVQKARVYFSLDSAAKVALVGHKKDGTSFYLNMFPQWMSIGVPNFKDISATPIREAYFLSRAAEHLDLAREADCGPSDIAHFENKVLTDCGRFLPVPVRDFLRNFVCTPEYAAIRDEYEFVQKYKEPFKSLPYPPIFTTVDAVVVQSGHILLVQRRGRPGKGLWALPGGFLNASERIEDAVYRELREETKIKVPEPVLRGSTVASRVFDEVHRSARGRTITHAFLIHLKGDGVLPKVKGSDDAAKAKWVPLADVKREMMFEDHAAIISVLTSLL